jgi:hypothetical protein
MIMRTTQVRAVPTAARGYVGWAAELDGDLFGHSTDKEIARAAAHRRTPKMQDNGRAGQVRLSGEAGFHLVL